MLFHLYIGEHGETEMSLDPVFHDFTSSGEPDSPRQVERPVETGDIRETVNVGPNLMNLGTSTINNIQRS